MSISAWNALDYEKNSSAQQTWAQELIAKLNLQGHERILDIGCGDGKVTAELAKQVPHGSVVGIDSSDVMIYFARTRYLQETFPNLRFLRIDACELPFQNEFDLVFSSAVLHWIQDHILVLQGISHSLRSGGKMLLQMGGRGNVPAILEAVETIKQLPQWRTYFRHFSFPYYFYGIEEYQHWLDIADLQPIRIDLIPKLITYESSEALAGWLRTTWFPYTQQVPESMRNGFIWEVVECYLDRYPATADGMIQVQVVRLEVEAQKI